MTVRSIPLEDVCDVEYGTRVVQKRDGGSAYPVYGGGGATFKVDQFNREDRLVVARFGMSEECVRFVTGKFFLNDSGLTVAPKNGALLQRFLDYQLLYRSGDIYALGKGTAQKNLDVPVFRTLPLYVPGTPEQQRLVGILDEAFAGIATAKASAEKNLQNAGALFESHLQTVFVRGAKGWPDKRLGHVTEVQSGGTPLVSQKKYWNGDIPWYSSGELNTMFTTQPERQITQAGLDGSNAKLFPSGALLIGMYDTAALKMSILDRDGAFNQAIAGVMPNNEVEMEFILQAINAVKSRLLLERRGVRQKNLSLGKIKDISLPFPTRAEQRAIVSRLRIVSAETERLDSLYRRKLFALDILKKSLLHQAFFGAL